MATVVFFGNERLVSGLPSTDAPVLRSLIADGHKIAAIVSHHSEGKSRNNRELEVAAIASEHGIPLFLPNKPADIYDELVAMNAQVAVLAAYGRIIPQRVIDIFPIGIVNVHPSLLPKYRGPTPIESAIANGDTQTGVSIMQLSAGMDEGAVYGQTIVPITTGESKFELYQRLSVTSAAMIHEMLPLILSGNLEPTPQDDNQASYCKLLEKSDAKLDTLSVSADQAERLVRAYIGFPKSKVTVANKEIIITKAHVSTEKKTILDIACQDGKYLSIDELVGPSGRTMKAADFLNGYAAA